LLSDSDFIVKYGTARPGWHIHPLGRMENISISYLGYVDLIRFYDYTEFSAFKTIDKNETTSNSNQVDENDDADYLLLVSILTKLIIKFIDELWNFFIFPKHRALMGTSTSIRFFIFNTDSYRNGICLYYIS
ncbi:9818_t:CDS:2, partial [Dentiscutata heterogama]